MSDKTSGPFGPAAQNVEETMGSLVDSAVGFGDGSVPGTIMAATDGGGMDGILPQDERTDENVTAQLNVVDGGGGTSDKRGSATRFMGDY